MVAMSGVTEDFPPVGNRNVVPPPGATFKLLLLLKTKKGKLIIENSLKWLIVSYTLFMLSAILNIAICVWEPLKQTDLSTNQF